MIEKDALTLEEWLVSTQEKRDDLDAFGKSPLPTDAGQRHNDQDRAIQNADDAGRLLADAESFLTQFTAKAVFTVRSKYAQSSSDERKLLVKDEVRDIQRLVDGLAVTHRTIQSRLFLSMNANRAGR